MPWTASIDIRDYQNTQIEYHDYKYRHDGAWITRSEFQAIDELVDWLIEKNRKGYVMVNSVAHLCAMKPFIRGALAPWACQAGKMSMVIRLDGSFVPCFELYGSDEDWGNIYEGPKFDPDRLSEIKQHCTSQCLSTCNFQVCHYSSSVLYTFQWLAKHAYSSILGTS